MLALAFIKWWYGPGWRHFFMRQRDLLSQLAESFSVGILLRTLFSPWKRIISYGDQSLAEQFRALADNGVSRMVGFMVRTFVLMAAAVVLLATSVFSIAGMLFWPLIPPLSLALIVLGVILPL